MTEPKTAPEGKLTEASTRKLQLGWIKGSLDGCIVSRTQEGRFIFDYVDPGTYTLAADMKGFKKLIQRNIGVQQRGGQRDPYHINFKPS